MTHPDDGLRCINCCTPAGEDGETGCNCPTNLLFKRSDPNRTWLKPSGQRHLLAKAKARYDADVAAINARTVPNTPGEQHSTTATGGE